MYSLMGGLDIPMRGQVLYEGKNINNIGLAQHRRHNVAFVFQNYNLIDYMTAAAITEVLKESAHEYGKCVIVVSHSTDLEKKADFLYELKDGELKCVKKMEAQSTEHK